MDLLLRSKGDESVSALVEDAFHPNIEAEIGSLCAHGKVLINCYASWLKEKIKTSQFIFA